MATTTTCWDGWEEPGERVSPKMRYLKGGGGGGRARGCHPRRGGGTQVGVGGVEVSDLTLNPVTPPRDPTP